MKIKIKRAKVGDFDGDDGQVIRWRWYKATSLEDGTTFEFGSRDVSHEEGKEYDLDIEKTARADGSFKYKENFED